MSDDKITEHPNLRLRQDVDSLRNEVKTLVSLYQQTSQAIMIAHEEIKLLKELIANPKTDSKN